MMMKRIPEESTYTREQLIRRVKPMRAAERLRAGKAAGQELWLDTAAGRVRALGYGFDRPEMLPLFIDIHGGGFVLGSPEMDDPYLPALAESAGVKILSLDYSLAPESPFPKALDECYAAVRYARKYAAEFSIDPERIAVGGHSAGGNLSAAVRLKDAANELHIRCLILDYPPTDLYTDPYEKPQPKGSLPPRLCRLFDACYLGDKEVRKSPLVSPVFAAKEQLAAFPPTLIITAGRDSLCAEDEAFRDRLAEAGAPVTHRRFGDSFHGFTLGRGADAVEGWRLMADFLKENI
jgi:acetyl esterase